MMQILTVPCDPPPRQYTFFVHIGDLTNGINVFIYSFGFRKYSKDRVSGDASNSDSPMAQTILQQILRRFCRFSNVLIPTPQERA